MEVCFANEVYTVRPNIWSSGNVPQPHRALSIVFSWWVGGITIAIVGHGIRCHKAWKQDEKLNDLARTASHEGQQSSAASGTGAVHRTPSETLLEAAEAYCSAYGPSASPPYGWLGDSDTPPVGAESSEQKEQEAPEAERPHERDASRGRNEPAVDSSRVKKVEGTPDYGA